MLAIRWWHAALAAACLVGLAATTTQAQPTGACCVSWDCTITTQNDCQAMMGRYLGDGTSCGFVISNPNLPIPDYDPAGVIDVLTVSDSFPLLGVRIDVMINHTFLGDLTIAIEHQGLSVPLWSRVCGGNDNMDVVFDDAGPPVVCASPTVGDVAPLSCGGDLLALFDGMDSAGDWTIHVADHAGADVGTLVRWSVHFFNPCRVADLVVCEPQPPNHPPTYWYDVTPGNFGRCDFHVRVFDPDPANYTNVSRPFPTWQFAVHQVGTEWWASWWDPGCQHAIFGPFRFQFDNPGPSVWSDWKTTIAGTNDPNDQVIDEAANHPQEPDGLGYRVHVPSAPTGACCVSWNCYVVTRFECDAMKGIYHGDGSPCFVFDLYPVNPNLPIPDLGSVTHVMTLPDLGPVHDLKVDVIINHTWLGDLQIQVEHQGVVALLWNRVCGGNDNMDVVFDDAGAAVQCASPTLGNIMPTSCGGDPLALFNGLDSGGDWTITVFDRASGDIGTLVQWSLHLPRNVCVVRDSVVCEPQPPNHPPNYWYTVTPGDFGRCDFHVRVFDPNPANYLPGPMPANTWQFAVHQVGNEWWASWWDPNCQNAIFWPFTFSFTNANPSAWSDWTTTISATNDPRDQVIDEAANHSTEPDGLGYRVHVPVGEDAWYWKDYNGDEPGGFMPDYDQNQDFNGDGAVDANYCGPVAVANSLWWFHRKYPAFGVVPATWTNIELIQDLAQRMATNGQTPSPSGHVVPYTGTYVDDMQLGIDDYLQAQGLTSRFYEHTEPMPDFDFIATEVLRSQDVVLLVGFYHIDEVVQYGPDEWLVFWTRTGGHYLTVAGVDPVTRRVALSDTDQDGAEQGASGVVRPPGADHNHDGDNDPTTTIPFRDPAYDHAVHNDEDYAAHDFFTLRTSISPGGQLALIRDGDPLAYGGEMEAHHVGDAGGTYQPPPTMVNLQQLIENGYPIPQVCQTYAEIEYAVVVSPQPVDIVVCEPQPPFHPPTYWYDVTVNNSIGVLCDFHVEVFDPNPANYTNIVGPANWSFTVQQVGSQWWATWWTPGCTDPVWAPGQAMFGFDNPSASTWGHWRTTYSGDQDPDTPWLADRSENHASEPDGYGYRVHAPVFQALPEACCLPDGTCLDLDYMVCVQQLGGWPQGPGTLCANVPYCPDLKWVQPPTYSPDSPLPHCFWGWDEPSDWLYGPIVADDFPCLAPKPITDIHWWGSYLGWMEPFPPPVGPSSFQIGIWTDVPAGWPGNPYPYSHPGVMIREWWVSRADLEEQYVGCDFTPWTELRDSAFRYDFQIPQAEWFWQAAGDNVYWLSIAAVNCQCNGDFNGDGLVNAADLAFFMNCVGQPPLGPCAQADLNCDGVINAADMAIMACMVSTPNWWECCPYEQYWTWGWKTRRPHWNDDGVRMWLPVQPVPGVAFVEGMPLEDPMGESWDMAFVFTTGCLGDSNCDGFVNWRDIDFFVAAMNNNVAAWRAMFAPNTPPCSFWNNDVNGDGVVSWRDIDPFVAIMNTVCP